MAHPEELITRLQVNSATSLRRGYVMSDTDVAYAYSPTNSVTYAMSGTTNIADAASHSCDVRDVRY